MLWAARQLLAPVNYLWIRHGDTLFRSKVVYDFVFPIIFTVLTCSTFAWLGVSLAIFMHEELVKRLTDLLALTIVFYLAALAAVATFDRKGIDDPLKSGDATLRLRHHDTGEFVEKALSYRQFISYLFGYLSFLSICLYIFIMVFAVGWPELEKQSEYTHGYWILRHIVDPAIFCLIFFWVWQLTFTSLLGIYFLTVRIQSLSDPEF